MSPLERMEAGTWIDWVRHLIIQREANEVAEHRDKLLRAALGLSCEMMDNPATTTQNERQP